MSNFVADTLKERAYAALAARISPLLQEVATFVAQDVTGAGPSSETDPTPALTSAIEDEVRALRAKWTGSSARYREIVEKDDLTTADLEGAGTVALMAGDTHSAAVCFVWAESTAGIAAVLREWFPAPTRVSVPVHIGGYIFHNEEYTNPDHIHWGGDYRKLSDATRQKYEDQYHVLQADLSTQFDVFRELWPIPRTLTSFSLSDVSLDLKDALGEIYALLFERKHCIDHFGKPSGSK